ncbi:hemerythrin domain-containing protein [Thermoleptolyngbya sp. C42_A2020_037]|uniref:hemerythrin domain-containing protein n=1 Tax=Thermoleptolyngbya sp. C42_A2020_037 TaxID=2747799 RepID=UPI0019E9C9A0|nr:hemerythrin domain-containing protein [Thermoleptolyngbya sp. C42_A2020_037]
MVMSSDDQKRVAIAEKLADMKAVQKLLIANEQKLLSATGEPEIRDRLQKMLDDDRKNIEIIDTVMVQYGVQARPTSTTQKLLQDAEHWVNDSNLSLYEKTFQHELLKHKQVMTGLLIHKAAQVVGADVDAAITPLNTVNFENRAHQEQLKGVLEVLGVREMTGQEPKQGLWARVQDAIAALSGVTGSAASQAGVEMSIQDLIRMDHQKVDTLFKEIEKTDDPRKIEEYFGQLHKDLTVHAEAEEAVVYPAVRPFYGADTEELYQEQAEMRTMLSSLRLLNPGSPNFNADLKTLKDAVKDHVRQEESTMFAAIRNNLSDEENLALAQRFQAEKQQIQTRSADSGTNFQR